MLGGPIITVLHVFTHAVFRSDSETGAIISFFDKHGTRAHRCGETDPWPPGS